MDERVFFHLTGVRADDRFAAALGFRPALFARYQDLTKLRHDYPIVLPQEGGTPIALSALVDDVLRAIAPHGIDGERLRRNALRIEREIRALVANGATGTLGALWTTACERLAMRGPAFADDAGRARAAIHIDGELIACDGAAPSRLVAHLWGAAETKKAAGMRRTIDALALRLSELVRADHLRSAEGRSAARLRAGLGERHHQLFDFDVMADLLVAPSGASALSDRRRERIARTVATLRDERFFAAEKPFIYAFDSVAAALAAYREREPAMVDLVRAIAIAELEVRGGYVEAKHDAFFERFDRSSLGDDDRLAFPDYLVSLDAERSEPADRARVIEGLTSGLPLKIVFATGDAFGLDAQLATTAMGLGDAFIIQSSAAQLYRIRERVAAALAYRGPALISVFAPDSARAEAPSYLVSAAATESRAFPTFSYDPAAGTDWSQRFSLHDDPQRERTWPVHALDYADASLRRVSVRVEFTLADLALCDPRHVGEFARVPKERWDDALVPIAAWVERTDERAVPFVYAVDPQASLHRLVVSERLARQTRRCADAWRRLLEIDDLKRKKTVVAAPVAEQAAVAVAAAVQAPPAAESAPTGPSSDEPYIETPRCTTCNECTGVNPRMFAYNDNKQAYIKDLSAGTFKDLVEAAEGCQVAIIHPGKPRDPNEPGLDELLKRAEAFR